MSKKKDRENISYRYCPICGGRQIIVYSEKIFKTKYYINCYKCNKHIFVKIKKEKNDET